MTPKISVVICTYNRIEVLKIAVESVISQEIIAENYELIIIDNNSKDGTKEFVQGVIRQHKNVRYVFEGQQGLSFARNRGWHEATAEYVAYIDDDCILPPGYLATMLTVIEEKHPDIFGGPIIAWYDFQKPHWVKDEYFSFFKDKKSEWLKSGDEVYGGNMIFRKQILKELGGFDSNLGMKGTELGFAEEIQIQREAWNKFSGLGVYFCSDLWLYHQTRSEKARLRWQMKYYYNVGLKARNYELIGIRKRKSGAISLIINRIRLCGDFGWLVLRIIAKFIKSLVYRNSIYPYWQNYVVERIFQVDILQLGRKSAEIKFIREQVL